MITATVSEVVLDVIIKFHTYDVGAAPVPGDDGEVSGIVSERDIVRALARHGQVILAKPVSAIMARRFLSCQTSDHIQSATKIMLSRRVRHLPVMEGRRLVGIVSIGDLLKPHLKEVALETGVLCDVARTAVFRPSVHL